MASSVYESMPLNQMLARIDKYHSGEGTQLVEKAWHFAEDAHAGQFRKSGEPYFSHPQFVASILTELLIDPPTIAAGLLHDTVEDCSGVTLDTIRANFGNEVADLVDGVTKLEKLNFADREEAQAESLRKMFMAMSRDIRVMLIKLADRLHNMRTLRYQAEDRRAAIARETVDIYAPIAHRLGVYKLKQEMEDLSLRYIDPENYNLIVHLVGENRAVREDNMRLVMDEISSKLDQTDIHYSIEGRFKHYYSIYRKMKLQNKSFDQIYDLIAIRVIVDTVPDCYTVLGIIHTLWNQIPGRFKDYISVPKVNMYQSLHTTVIGGHELPLPFEVQIRTWDMHRVAEYGIAAHWRYKEGGNTADQLDTKLAWIRSILDWQNDTRDSKEFVNTLKTDLFADELYLFTPKGDVISLPKDATPLDFAYRIHSEIGNKCVGAKVNGKIVPLDSTLKTGDRVEVMTSSSSKGPSTDWLRICRTPQAKTKIRQFLRKELKNENIELGRSIIEHECMKHNVRLSDLLKPEYCEPLLRKYSFSEMDDIFGSVGFGGISSAYVVSRLMDEQKAHTAPPVPAPSDKPPQPRRSGSRTATHGIVMEDNQDLDIPVRFAKCCSPVPGDEIIGYITRGRGVTIHKTDCPNVISSQENERRVRVSWAARTEDSYYATIKVVAYDRLNLLGDIATAISELGISISSVHAQLDDRSRISTVRLALDIHSLDDIDRVIGHLRRKTDVIDVCRITV